MRQVGGGGWLSVIVVEVGGGVGEGGREAGMCQSSQQRGMYSILV